MRPRTALLRQPHMAHLAEHPSLAAMDDATLAALEAFMAFCAAKGLTNPGEGDFAAFAELENRSVEELDRLGDALRELGLPEDMLDMLRAARDARARRAAYAVRPPGPLPVPRARKVSLRIDKLPEAWQATLGRLRAAGAFAPSILDRMEQRLGMFGWSARQAGHPIDLACADARHALTEDLTERSVRRGDGTEPRYAYLRSAWEEMLRFATAHGYDEATLTALRAGYEHLARRQARQDPLKMAKIHRAGTSSGLLRTASDLLAAASEKPTPNKRHWARNDAAAIGLGAVIPARPGDVFVNHVLGRGITYEKETDQYRFRYIPQKSRRNRKREPLNLLLERHFNPFIEALILQDNDPAYLPEVSGRGTVVTMPAWWQARISAPLK